MREKFLEKIEEKLSKGEAKKITKTNHSITFFNSRGERYIYNWQEDIYQYFLKNNFFSNQIFAYSFTRPHDHSYMVENDTIKITLHYNSEENYYSFYLYKNFDGDFLEFEFISNMTHEETIFAKKAIETLENYIKTKSKDRVKIASNQTEFCYRYAAKKLKKQKA